MKKIGLLLFFLTRMLCAEEAGPTYPFSLSGNYTSVSEAKFRTSDVEGEKLRFQQVNAALSYTHPFNEYWGLIFGAGYIGNEVKWDENPKFNETWFHYINFAVGIFTRSFPDWEWNATLAVNFDTEEFDFGDYALYDAIIQGKYEWCPWFYFHAGFIFEAGLNKEKMWPILGFDFIPLENLKIALVYPTDLSINWGFSEKFIIGGSIRFLRSRHRVQNEEPLPRAIFEYRTNGVEFDAILAPFSWFKVKGYIGVTTNGDLKITNRSNKQATHFKFKGSSYAGISAVLSY